jgi:hypothetical protein
MAASLMAPMAAAELLLRHAAEFSKSKMPFIVALSEIAYQCGDYESAARLLGLHYRLWYDDPQVEFGPPAASSRSRLAAKIPERELTELLTQGHKVEAAGAIDFGMGILRLLAEALGLAGEARAEFEAVARGRPVTADAGGATTVSFGISEAAVAVRTLPRDISSFTGREGELAALAAAAASGGYPSRPRRQPPVM